jgi:hypothetical protein
MCIYICVFIYTHIYIYVCIIYKNVQGAAIGDRYICSHMKNHDRRIPIPGFTEYGTGDHVGHPSPNMIEVSVFVCMNVCMYIYICMYTYIYMNTCIYMNVYIDTYMYKYIYIYMYIYMYTALQQLINRVIINAMTESFEPYFLFSNNIILQGFLFKSAQS